MNSVFRLLLPALLLTLPTPALAPDTVNVAILVYDGVYNTEFVAPMDVFDHVNGRAKSKVRVFLVAPELRTITSVEGLRFQPDFDFSNHPRTDILVIPSFENFQHDLGARNDVINWIAKTTDQARFVLSNCWGAFFLAKAGLLDGRLAMTYPPDIDKLAADFPKLETVKGVRFVRDGKFVTGGGGVASYDNALYVVEELWGKEVAAGIAGGLVKEWDLDRTPHRIRD